MKKLLFLFLVIPVIALAYELHETASLGTKGSYATSMKNINMIDFQADNNTNPRSAVQVLVQYEVFDHYSSNGAKVLAIKSTHHMKTSGEITNPGNKINRVVFTKLSTATPGMLRIFKR